jgi:GGDEF domain-containing protein
MTLDPFTVQAVAGAVVLFSAGLFVGETWTRRGADVDRVWSLAFAAAIIAALASLADAVEPSWLARAVSNGMLVAVPALMWSGVRAHGGRRPLVGLAGGAAVVAALGVLLAGPDGDPWAGGVIMLVGVAAASFAAGAAVLRGHLRRNPSGVFLGVLVLVLGGYFTARTVLYVTAGAYSEVFATYGGTAMTTVFLALTVNGASFSMIALRSRAMAEDLVLAWNFDAGTGARTAASYLPRAAAMLESAAPHGRQVALVALEPDDAETIRVAFGRDYADRAVVVCGEVVSMLLPPRSLLGIDVADGLRFEVLLDNTTPAEAEAWVEEVRQELLGTPLEVPGSRVRLTPRAGVAGTLDHGYDLTAMRRAACARAGAAARAAS